jgi:DNA-binding GntR family transcriptional regulator
MNMRAVRPKAIAQHVARHSEESIIYDKIHAAIVERRILPGVRLVEDQLAEVFGVSRIPGAR